MTVEEMALLREDEGYAEFLQQMDAEAREMAEADEPMTGDMA